MSKRKIIIIALLYVFAVNIYANSTNVPTINLLNDINYSTTKITLAKSSDMLVLNDVYQQILNNYDPQRIDSDVNDYVVNLANNIEGLRLVNIKKDRLDVIFDYKKSQAVAAAIPSPIGLVGSIAQFAISPTQAIASLIGTAASSALMYKAAVDELNLEKLEKEWELEDEERSRLNYLNLDSFSETANFANKNSVSKEYVMTIQPLTDFINILEDDNVKRRIEALQYSERRFKYFPTYWLELAQAYYDNNDFDNVIKTVEYYDKHFDYDEIFKQNYRYAQILTLYISSLIEKNKGESIYDFKDIISDKLEIIITNTAESDWLQRYFCAITYLSFAEIDDEYFMKAYDLFRLNCIQLSKEQEDSINIYKSPVSTPNEAELKSLTKDERKKEEAYYDLLAEERKVELPPINKAYILNIQSLASLMSVSKKLDKDLDFLEKSIVTPFFKDYYFDVDTYIETIKIEQYTGIKRILKGDKYKIIIPATYINNLSSFEVKFSGDNEYHDLYFNSSYEKNNKNNLPVEVINVERIFDNNIDSYIAEIELGYLNEWLESADKFELDIRINTNDCPIVFHFTGEDFKSLKNEYSYVEKNSNIIL